MDVGQDFHKRKIGGGHQLGLRVTQEKKKTAIRHFNCIPIIRRVHVQNTILKQKI
uniref:Uncharacterized protein n=1 Tax=Ciona intestinalis TaxID=7719 RepID=H2XV83_CIOIN